MFGLLGHLFLGFCIFMSITCLGQSTIVLTNVGDGEMKTFVSPVKFEGIAFDKRSQNASPISTSLSFEFSSDSAIGVVRLSWFRNNKEVDPIPDGFHVSKSLSSDKFKMNITLRLDDAEIIPGNYTLTVTEGSKSVVASSAVVSAPILPSFHKPKRVLEGDLFRIFCSVTGYPRPDEVFWWFSSIPIGQTEDDGALASALRRLQPLDVNTTRYSRTTSDEGVLHDTLVFSQLSIADNGLYACNTTNTWGSDMTLLLVNVKDRWAALWPFVGIVVEVTVLVVAILMYERHQMRSKPTANVAATKQPVASAAENPTANAVGEYPPQQAPVENRLRTPVQPPNSEQTSMDAVDSAAVSRPADSRLDIVEPKQDELRLRGATTKC